MRNKKVINIVVNVIVAIILVFVFILTLNIILSGDKGYTSIFGTAYVSVESNSMKGDKADNFQKGDLLKIKILDEEEKKNLQPGDVITFWDNTIVDNQLVLNSHRIIKVEKQSDGSVRYETKGDNNLDADKMLIPDVTIVGIYEGKIGGLGNVVSVSLFHGLFCVHRAPRVFDRGVFCVQSGHGASREEQSQRRNEKRTTAARTLRGTSRGR